MRQTKLTTLQFPYLNLVSYDFFKWIGVHYYSLVASLGTQFLVLQKNYYYHLICQFDIINPKKPQDDLQNESSVLPFRKVGASKNCNVHFFKFCRAEKKF